MATFRGLSGDLFRANSQFGGSSDSSCGPTTLIDYVGKAGIDVGDDLVVLIHHLQYACKRIASLVASPYNSSLGKFVGAGGSERDASKALDIVSSNFRTLHFILSWIENLRWINAGGYMVLAVIDWFEDEECG